MADTGDQAQDFEAQHLARSLAAVGKPAPKPQLGTCEACLDEDVPVLVVGNMPRCTPCRSRWEKRR